MTRALNQARPGPVLVTKAAIMGSSSHLGSVFGFLLASSVDTPGIGVQSQIEQPA